MGPPSLPPPTWGPLVLPQSHTPYSLIIKDPSNWSVSLIHYALNFQHTHTLTFSLSLSYCLCLIPCYSTARVIDSLIHPTYSSTLKWYLEREREENPFSILTWVFFSHSRKESKPTTLNSKDYFFFIPHTFFPIINSPYIFVHPILYSTNNVYVSVCLYIIFSHSLINGCSRTVEERGE